MTATQMESGTWPDNVSAKGPIFGASNPVFVDLTQNTTFLGVIARHAVSLGMAQCANVSQAVHFHFGPNV